MSGSTFGTRFTITTWGESHGKAIGVVIDGCPAGLTLHADDIQSFLNRRKPGQSKFTTNRQESDCVEILSGVFEGQTTGAPISIMVKNQNQHSKDYDNIKDCYRPGHADYTYDMKYGFRDYRGGGRSSGRETIGRVAAGAVASKILNELGIKITAYTRSIGNIIVPVSDYHYEQINENALYMPNNDYAQKASAYLEGCIEKQDSAGGTIECIVTGMPVGIGEPVFRKLDALLSGAIMSIGAVKGVEIGDGFDTALTLGSKNNDTFCITTNQTSKPNSDTKIRHLTKTTNHSGGILGGMSDGSPIILRAAIKPTPSISQAQKTVTKDGNETTITITGRHDPVIVPRAVVVVESMTAITLLDMLMDNLSVKLDYLKDFYR